MGRTPIPRIAPARPVSAEIWVIIHDAAVEAGVDRDTAVAWADERYWPHDVACPELVRPLCSPFRDLAKRSTR